MSLADKLISMIEFTRGCTEPASIALNAAWAGAYIKNAFTFHLTIDRMTYKNAYRAGIPNAGENIGVENAFLFGYLIAKPALGLEIFTELNDSIIERVAPFKERLDVEVIDSPDLFIHTTAIGDEGKAEVLTTNSHTNIAEVVVNGRHIVKNTMDELLDVNFEEELYEPQLWEQLIDELYENNALRDRINEALQTNRQALSFAYNNSDDPIHAVVLARMRGDNIRIASCAGSGNKGLVALLAPLLYGRSSNQERLTKALILSCLVTSLITSKLGFVSSFCGVFHAAAVGAMAAILYLSGELTLFERAFYNYIEAIGGALCDGAKKGCAMKATAAVSTALLSMDLARSGSSVDYRDGYLAKNFLQTIKNLENYRRAFGVIDNETIKILKEKI